MKARKINSNHKRESTELEKLENVKKTRPYRKGAEKRRTNMAAVSLRIKGGVRGHRACSSLFSELF